MKILFIAPLPPPITGHSIAARAVLDHLRARHNVEIINLSEGSLHDGTITLKRAVVVLVLICKVFVAAKRSDRVYLTISESIAGNVKDLFIYSAIGGLIGATVIHLHGGSFEREILERSSLLRKINKYFLSRIGAAIVSGPSHLKIFGQNILKHRICMIPNFAQDSVYVESSTIEEKFGSICKTLRILYFSGMTHGKGYQILLEAYERLSNSAKASIQLDFAGKFDDRSQKEYFLNRISTHSNIHYHGVVDSEMKANLFAQAHIFVLPTSFMEGQPISILEAYAAGCVVLTTSRPGIVDIFDPSKNGFFISSEDSTPICEIIESRCRDLSSLLNIALHNHKFALHKFRESVFCDRVEAVLNSVSCSYSKNERTYG